MEAIYNRLLKNYKHRKKWAKRNNIQAYRLYERDLPDYPFIIDLYGEHAIVYHKGNREIDLKKPQNQVFLLKALLEILSTTREKVVFKTREKQKGINQYKALDNKKSIIEIREHQAIFLINLHDYLDTGLFLDHRPIRQRIHQEAKGKTFLNLFSYTASVSVFAALAGAQTTSVDLSKTYQEWAKSNFTLNGLDINKHNFITQSALSFLEQESQEYDLIFLDPPTFSSSKKMKANFEVERDQVFLIDNSMKLLREKGKLYFSNNKRTFKLQEELKSKYKIKDISLKTIPEDFRDKKIHNCFEISF